MKNFQVIEDLETYDGGQITKYRPPWYRRRKRSLSWPGSKSAGLIFEVSSHEYKVLCVCMYHFIIYTFLCIKTFMHL